jgi:iron uptake system EfeUOB component EfeO/EfeM
VRARQAMNEHVAACQELGFHEIEHHLWRQRATEGAQFGASI